jgi:hypothetical protein
MPEHNLPASPSPLDIFSVIKTEKLASILLKLRKKGEKRGKQKGSRGKKKAHAKARRRKDFKKE